MNPSRILLAAAGASLLFASTAMAKPKPRDCSEFKTRVIVDGLNSPSGIVIGRSEDVRS
jgi:hypothetical protein